jgi:exopolysaccharide biosynthesis polyprenyl glycosylphosphotransferase
MSGSESKLTVDDAPETDAAAAVVIHPPREPAPAPPAPAAGGPPNNTAARAVTDEELTLLQICCDFLCVCVALPVALVVLAQLSTVPVNAPGQFMTDLKVDSLFPVTVVTALALGGVYRVTHRRLQPSAFLEMRELSFGVGCGCVLALAVGSLLHAMFGTTEPYATQLVTAVIVAVAVITMGRIVVRSFLHALTTTRVLVVGSGTTAERIMLSVRQDPGMTLVGRVVDADIRDSGTFGAEALGHVADLPELCRRFDVHRVLVTGLELRDETLDLYRNLQDSVHIAMVPRYYELVSWRSRLTDLAGMPFLEIAQPHLSVWDRCMKRAFDICISSVVLCVTAPLLAIVAIGVKFSSPGPVFFRQIRIGRDILPFTVIKFRSMTLGTEMSPPADDGDATGEEAAESTRDAAVALHELRNKKVENVRITRFGAFLRRTGIDEIPQFINVLRGDMSVVGPRPFIPSESDVEGWATRRFDVRPGITGLWQVSGRNDLTRSDLVQLDYLYVASWSLWWDLKIMFETPKTMARGIGAY